MKLLVLATAALISGAAFSPVAASAQHNPSRHGGWHYRYKTVCKVHWEHHRKVRRCHKVRVRYRR